MSEEPIYRVEVDRRLTLLALLLALGISTGCGERAASDPIRVVPDLHGKTVDEALRALLKARLCSAHFGSATGGGPLSRTGVVDQDPAPGARVPANAMVNVWFHYGSTGDVYGDVINVCGDPPIYTIRNVTPG